MSLKKGFLYNILMDNVNKDEWVLKEKSLSIAKSASRTFLIAKKNKRKNKVGEDIEEEAIFKIQSFISGANEIIAFHLAKIVGLQITDVQILSRDNIKDAGIDSDGTISFKIPDPHDVWFNLPPTVKDNPSEHIYNYNDFALLCIFDIFICNPDRHDRNLLALDLLTGKFLFYIIDHGHSLLGVNGDAWPSSIATEIERFMGSFSNIYRRIATTNSGLFNEAVKKIQTITDGQIDEIINSVPEAYLPKAKANEISSGLKTRRNNIELLLNTWYTRLRLGGNS